MRELRGMPVVNALTEQIQKQIDELNSIIFDENQTVKNVNNAKEKKLQLEEKINSLYPPVPF